MNCPECGQPVEDKNTLRNLFKDETKPFDTRGRALEKEDIMCGLKWLEEGKP
jgi:hypothetical protein